MKINEIANEQVGIMSIHEQIKILGSYDPIIDRVSYNFNDDFLTKMHKDLGFSISLFEKPREIRIEDLKANPSYIPFFYTAYHENFHRYQMQMSSFGRFFINSLWKTSYYLPYVFKILKSHANMNYIQYPFITYLGNKDWYKFNLYNIKKEILNAKELLKHIEVPYWAWRIALYDVEKYEKGYIDVLNEYIKTDFIVTDEIEPEVKIKIFNNKKYRLSGRSIVEGMATSAAYGFCHEIIDPAFTKETMLDAFFFSDYGVSVAYTMQEGERLGIDESILPIIHALLSDIALSGNLWNIFPTNKVNWKEVHPGWRYVNALEATMRICKKLKNDQEAIREFDEITYEICSKFKWSTPLEACTQFTKHAKLLEVEKEWWKNCDNIRQNEYSPLFMLNGPQDFPPLLYWLEKKIEKPVDCLKDEYINHRIHVLVAKLIDNLYWGKPLICPFHQVDLLKNKKCVNDCIITSNYEKIIGSSIADIKINNNN